MRYDVSEREIELEVVISEALDLIEQGETEKTKKLLEKEHSKIERSYN
ncbi:uncharacterized protein CBO05P1_282 [Clostridium botulinum B str. Osaka05]|uniref:Uncharacterized protein n=1 Tax=Clostridium botulinum B str. Osaka05 TaxID=1407017 RepID=A0A060N3C9_CLOBO|nr:hypothetical protein [Clostridium botulinum]BAO05001.1 uncharacterized protein CBO05P1_282 [Clostridium botulinum B str. Osaka05]